MATPRAGGVSPRSKLLPLPAAPHPGHSLSLTRLLGGWGWSIFYFPSGSPQAELRVGHAGDTQQALAKEEGSRPERNGGHQGTVLFCALRKEKGESSGDSGKGERCSGGQGTEVLGTTRPHHSRLCPQPRGPTLLRGLPSECPRAKRTPTCPATLNSYTCQRHVVSRLVPATGTSGPSPDNHSEL